MPMKPFVHINFAVLADGSATAAEISSAADWRRVHLLRELYDAVAVGAHTWERDRPRLSVRPERLGREPRRQPHRVIFGGRRPCATLSDGRTTFLVGPELEEEPAEGTVAIRARGHRLDEPLADLRRHGVRTLLVEGGPLLLGSFFAQGCFDRLTVFVATDCPIAAARAARQILPEPPPLRARRFGEGVLLSWRSPSCRP
jgi:2,5-diamino-6-(ribosylamino)-4(3H)-pyrimidinone 5'-phosphate reductase